MNNPTAFPIIYQPALKTNEGMTLRDYFAAQIMAARIALDKRIPGESTFEEYLRSEASIAYLASDVMLKAREQ